MGGMTRCSAWPTTSKRIESLPSENTLVLEVSLEALLPRLGRLPAGSRLMRIATQLFGDLRLRDWKTEHIKTSEKPLQQGPR
mmetsp:Transcript_68211/g.142553  ORF Transcript_68211/g.142553 Transcript_68211/m.142553 type:complete len:82 (+) Transcript_68211:2180-2425(+)